VTYEKTFKNGRVARLPVLPSDHFGLLLQLSPVGSGGGGGGGGGRGL
jgi:hypothetical protein